MNTNLVSMGMSLGKMVAEAYGKKQERMIVKEQERGKKNREILEVAKTVVPTVPETKEWPLVLEEQKNYEIDYPNNEVSKTIFEIVKNSTQLTDKEKIQVCREEEEKAIELARVSAEISEKKRKREFLAVVAKEFVISVTKIAITYMSTDKFNKNKIYMVKSPKRRKIACFM